MDPDSPIAQGLDSPLATIAVYEGKAQHGNRVLFAADKRQMDALPNDPEEGHPHIEIEDWQALATYPAN